MDRECGHSVIDCSRQQGLPCETVRSNSSWADMTGDDPKGLVAGLGLLRERTGESRILRRGGGTK